MYISFYEFVPIIKDFILKENPQTMLVISKSPTKYVKLFQDLLGPSNKKIKIDKLVCNDQIAPDHQEQQVYTYEYLTDERELEKYDCIFMTEVIENFSPDNAKKIISKLLRFTNKSLLLITPLFNSIPNEPEFHQVRMFHPTFFCHYDFSCIQMNTVYGKFQLYSFFPQPHKVTLEKYYIQPISKKTKKLKIGYVLPHKNLTGGMKCLLEQMRQLHKRGHEVYAIFRGQKGDSAIPSWSDIDVNNDISGQIIVSSKQDIHSLASQVDILMCGFITSIPDYADVKIPVVYWEQGYEGLYGDYGPLLTSEHPIRKQYKELYGSTVHFLAVADVVSDALQAKYNLQPKLLYNGIDGSFYKPNKEKEFSSTILLVGNPALGFKNFGFAFEVLNNLWSQGIKIKIKWACQQKPILSNVPFPVELFVLPSQSELAELYRSSDIFLCTSVYESFPMPPIEAMASGVPVIATNCGGIRTYGKSGENLLIVNQGDLIAYVEAVKFLLQSEEARQKFSENGLKTAQLYNFDRIVENMEDYFYSLVFPGSGAEEND